MNQDSNLLAPYISEITSKDKQLLQEAVLQWRPRTKNYEDSWGYVIQATRYEGFKWHDPKTGVLIFFGKKSASDSTLVVPLFFSEPAHLANVISQVRKKYKAKKVILKNVNPDEVKKFTTRGFRLYRDDERWSLFARFDDQTYPQLISNLQDIIKLEGKGYRYLRQALRKNQDMQIRPYQESDRDGVLAVFFTKDKNSPKGNKKKKKGIYYESHIMYPEADLEKFIVIDTLTKDIIGFTALSAINQETIAFVACLFKHGTDSANIWGVYQSLLSIHKNGYKLVNFGGCETEGSCNFVRRVFYPTQEIQKIHMIYE